MKNVAIWAAALGLVLVSAAGWEGSAHAKPKKRKHATRCVRFSEENSEDSPIIRFSVHNRCQKELSCKMSWTVTCDPGGQNPFEESAHVVPGDSFSVEASAEMCTQDWSIQAPTWTCQTVN